MNKKEMAVYISKMFSLYAFTQVIIKLEWIAAPFFTDLHNQYSGIQMFMMTLPSILLLFLSLFFWTKAELVSRLLLGNEKDNSNTVVSTSLNFQDLQVIAFSVVGLFIVSSVIPNWFANTIAYIEYRRVHEMISESWIKTWVTLTIKTIIGFYLLLGSKGFAGILAKIRRHGTEQ